MSIRMSISMAVHVHLHVHPSRVHVAHVHVHVHLHHITTPSRAKHEIGAFCEMFAAKLDRLVQELEMARQQLLRGNALDKRSSCKLLLENIGSGQCSCCE